MNLMLTGHLGFVGKHLMQRLQDEQVHSVFGFDLPNDFTNKETVEKFIQEYKIDIILHIGAMAGLPNCYENPTAAMQTNIIGTAVLLECAKKYNCKFLHTSTWAVNGKLEHPYDISKKASEDLVKMYNNLYDLDTMILRMATMYGPGMRQNGIICHVINKALNKEPLVLQGNGQQFRQFLFIDDAIQAYINAIENWKSGKIFEVQHDDKVSILEIANVYFPTEKIQFVEKRAGDEESFFIDNTVTKKELNWEPKVSLKEGMLRMKAWLEHK